MNLTKRAKIVIGTIALAGAVVATGGAFTAGGLNNTSADSFVGGTVSQEITGATVGNVAYTTSGIGAAQQIDLVVLTFTDDSANGKDASILFDGGIAGDYLCGEITGTPGTVTCTPGAGDEVLSSAASNLKITVVEPA